MFNKKPSKLSRYESPIGELPNWQLKLGEWYLRHKILLQKIGLGVLVVFDVVVAGYGLIGWGYYLAVGYGQDQQMFNRQVKEFANYRQIQPLYQAADLQIQAVEVFPSAPGRYDFVAMAGNPNERWVAYLSYKFSYNNQATKLNESVILPGQQVPIGHFGEESDDYPGSASLTVEKIDWRKVSPHAVENVAGFVKERLNFSVDNFEFKPASQSAGLPANIIKFELSNNTPYSFWEPIFYLELLDGGLTSGFIYLPVEKFLSGEIRQIDVRSLVENLHVSDVKVYPRIDIFAEKEYLEP